MGIKRRGNGWTRNKKRVRAPSAESAAAAAPSSEITELAPAAILAGIVLAADDDFEPAPAPDTDEPVSSAAGTPLTELPCIEMPRVEPAPMEAPAAAAVPASPADDEIAATFVWRKWARERKQWRRDGCSRVLFPFRNATDCFRMVDTSRLADEFAAMFVRGEDSWCEMVLLWLRQQKQRATLTFGELRAAVAAGHANVMELLRRYFDVHEDAIPLIQ